MKATKGLQDSGQSLWLGNTRSFPTSGTLRRSMEELSITGLTDPLRPRHQLGAQAFGASWGALMAVIESKSARIQKKAS